MDPLAPASRPARPLRSAAGVVALGWALFIAGSRNISDLIQWLARHAAGAGWIDRQSDMAGSVILALRQGVGGIGFGFPSFALLVGVSIAVALAGLARMVAVARVRAGFRDPIERVRLWSEAHRRLTQVIVAVPALYWLLSTIRQLVRTAIWTPQWNAWIGPSYSVTTAAIACVVAVAAFGLYRLTRGWARSMLEAGVATEAIPRRADDRIQFDAVAVTAETRGAVAAMTMLSVVAAALLASARTGQVATLLALGAYVVVAALGAYAFRRASKVAVGVDGVFVTGTSRTRFFAYNGLSGARPRGSDLELLRGGKVVLRLQLHGADATLTSAILTRVQDAITNAEARVSAVAGEVVRGASQDELARLAQGATDYRSPALARAQLWGLVEGPSEDAGTRAEAARALVATSRTGDVARLRVAGTQCAEPKLRVLLEELATEDEADDAAAVAPAVLRAP